MRKGGHKILGLAALASLMLIGGMWAAWTQEITAAVSYTHLDVYKRQE